MNMQQLRVARTLATVLILGAVVTAGNGIAQRGTHASTASGPTIVRPAAVPPTTASTSCMSVEQFRSARCNDLRHFGREGKQAAVRDPQRGAERPCDDPKQFRTSKCNDTRHFGPLPR